MLAKTGHAFSLTLSATCGVSTNRLFDFIDDAKFPVCVPGRTAIFAMASTTRAKTYITICWFTLPCLPRPKTM